MSKLFHCKLELSIDKIDTEELALVIQEAIENNYGAQVQMVLEEQEEVTLEITTGCSSQLELTIASEQLKEIREKGHHLEELKSIVRQAAFEKLVEQIHSDDGIELYIHEVVAHFADGRAVTCPLLTDNKQSTVDSEKEEVNVNEQQDT